MSARSRRLDERSLLPRDYLRDAWAFGRSEKVALYLPPEGDPISLQVALAQHRLACRIRTRHDPRDAGVVTSRFGFSKQFWSLCLLGEAWMGETVFAAATTLVLDRRADR